MKIHCENGMGREVNPFMPDKFYMIDEDDLYQDLSEAHKKVQFDQFESTVQSFPCYLDGKPFMGKGEFEGQLVTMESDEDGEGKTIWRRCYNPLLATSDTMQILAITPPVDNGQTIICGQTCGCRGPQECSFTDEGYIKPPIENKSVEAQVNAMAHTLYVEPEPDDSVAMQMGRENNAGEKLSNEILAEYGFKNMPHFTVMNSCELDLGRNRYLSVGGLGSPNEMLYIGERDRDSPHNSYLVCLHNWDYDGWLTIEKIQAIYSAITGKALNQKQP